ncbi:right-handed parallel beta-helix repeat-containing protein [Methylomonas fluvii]|uniref:Right-handed parallel beta-helix repeat-containing protein n=1 Tax=Methylomonas fluvii TaxID=1854564 RepID=A0ABR9D9U8_9GAMM|nr:right-handed parallel beta-helix repeat-containing protein [Methylomonas fluvii]MBD9359879.1 right-handed parallel beta-helix repeat-containing protein [Methylomonas fluvii]
MFIKLVITLTFATFCSAAAAKDFYVSPSGSDSLNGLSPSVNFWTKTGPFKTLTRARNAIRQLKAAGKFNEAITVHVGKGTYQLQATLELDDRDSGVPGQEITWEGEKGVSIISGGIQIKNCQPYDQNTPLKVLNCPVNNSFLDAIKGIENERIHGNAPRFELFVNEIRMHLARWPDSDWAHIRNPLSTATERNFAFTVHENMPAFAGNLTAAQVHIFPGSDFFDQYIGISDINYSEKRISLLTNTKQDISIGRRFYIQNIQSELNNAKEWFYDKENSQIQFIPPKNETINKITVSSIQNILKIDSLTDVNFKNLKFQHSTATAIIATNAKRIYFDNSEFSNITGKAIEIDNSVNITVSNCIIYNTGLGGISISGGDRPTLSPSDNIIHNNHIHHYDSDLYTNSPAIEVDGVATEVTNNLIDNGNGKGIRISGNDHIISKNEITAICKQSGDCGAIYTGRDWTYRGNIISFNSIHDFTGYSLNENTLNVAKNVIEYIAHGARGLYLDDAASGVTAYGNIFNNAGSIGIQIGGGRDNLIENNIIKTDRFAILVDYRGGYFNWQIPIESLKSMPINNSVWLKKYPVLGIKMNNPTWPEGNIFQKNVIISNKIGGRSLQYWMPKEKNIIRNNIVWNPTEEFRVDYVLLDVPVTQTGATWAQWIKKSGEKNSLNADPCVTVTRNSINVSCNNSPINEIGFLPIPSDIGLIDQL